MKARREGTCAYDRCQRTFWKTRAGRIYCSDRCRDRNGGRRLDPQAPTPRETHLAIIQRCPLYHGCGEGPVTRLAEHVLYEHGIDPDVLFPVLKVDAPLLPSFRTMLHGAMA